MRPLKGFGGAIAAAAIVCAVSPQPAAAQGQAAPSTSPTATASAYADARTACARQGQRIKVAANQTNDDLLLTRGVAMTFECVGVARAVPASRPKAARRRPATKRAAAASN